MFLSVTICIVSRKGGNDLHHSLRRLYRFVKTMLHTSDRLQAQLRDKVRMQAQLCNAHPEQLGRRLQLLPEATKRVLADIEQRMVSQIRGFLQLEIS